MNEDLTRELSSYPEEVSHTHKATVTVYSDGAEGMISVKVRWDPDIEVKDLGYLPAAYQFIQDFVLPAIEQAKIEWEIKPMMRLQPPSEYSN